MKLFSPSTTGDGAGSSTSPTKKPAATEGVDNTSPSKEPTTGSPEEESPGKDSGNGSLLNDSSVGGDDDQVKLLCFGSAIFKWSDTDAEKKCGSISFTIEYRQK